MNKLRKLAGMLAVTLLLSLPALADSTPDAAVSSPAVQLAGAYQSGYLSVVGTACFQLYSSMGIIASDLSAGHINSATALSALEQNGLLLSVCQSSLEDVRALTSAEDEQGAVLLGRLAAMLDALTVLHSALADAASTPRGDKAGLQAASKAVDSARSGVELALENYAKPL